MDRYRIFARDGFKCGYCGMSSHEDGVKLHVDHIVAKLLGGKRIAGNLITACASCNISKHATILGNEEEILRGVARRNEATGLDSLERVWGSPADKVVHRKPPKPKIEVREVMVEPSPWDLLWSVWSLEEAARKLHKRISEVRKMIKEGELIGRRSGRTWLIIDPDWDDRW